MVVRITAMNNQHLDKQPAPSQISARFVELLVGLSSGCNTILIRFQYDSNCGLNMTAPVASILLQLWPQYVYTCGLSTTQNVA